MAIQTLTILSILSLATPYAGTGQLDAPLPTGVKAVWALDKAYREATPTRERVCLNGLWRWQPAVGLPDTRQPTPNTRWGYFKVPGAWPGIQDYLQKDCQTVFAYRAWKDENMAGVKSAWYQREVTVPEGWKGRRVALSAEYVNSLAEVYLDGKKAGDIRFPVGEVDLTAAATPGKHLLSMLVTAMPLKAVMTTYTDTNKAREVAGNVARRGLCGDVWLVSEPRGPRIGDVQVRTSTRKGEITFDAALQGLSAGRTYTLLAAVPGHGKTPRLLPLYRFAGEAIQNGRIAFTDRWRPDRLWDIHTPQNVQEATLTLGDANGKVLDISHHVRFGYREFWIDGRDFYLNGSRIWLSVVPLDNAQVGAAWSTYAGAKESLERLKSFGINFVYTHNYDCEPGSHLSFEEILRAADDVGMLVALSQPHFSAYDWKRPDAEEIYARHAAFYTKVAGSHPCVVAYAMSHNACSYDEAKNPDLIDGIYQQRDAWASNNVKQALRAEAVVHRLDPSRIVYHHSSGNLGSMYTENFYVNFAPKQELDDWFEHWATKGVKPLFLCEYCAPSTWDWTMYRGWFKGKREWGSAQVPWDFEVAEWNAQFVGDRAYQITEAEKQNLRWEAQQYRTKEGWYRWDYPHPVGSRDFPSRNEVFADYITDNWRSYRTWGVSAFVPWEYEFYWDLKPGVDRKRRELPVDWERLQRPGYSPDYIDQQYDSMNMAYGRDDWVPNEAGKALIRNNRPLLAYIAGKPSKFTSKDHIFRAGETVEKQLVIVNNSRVPVSGTYDLTVAGTTQPTPFAAIETGQIVRFPLSAKVPVGKHRFSVSVKFSTGEVQTDEFDFQVAAPPPPVKIATKTAVYDPKGETRKLLDGLAVKYEPVDGSADLSKFDLLIIGKQALTLTNAIPDIRRVRTGLKVILFEQSAEVLEQRLGFRVAEYGLRQVFPRVKNHPLLADLDQETLRDWRGEATLSTPRLQYTLKPMYGPMVKWCGIDVPHLWRCGCQGNVASVLIEKPARGDFLPIVDGGYSLQYSPLMVYREGSGMILFCQMDVTGRTESDPAAERLARNVLQFAADWKATPQGGLVFSGAVADSSQLDASGFVRAAWPQSGVPLAKELLVLGPGEENRFPRELLDRWLLNGRVVSIGAEGNNLFGTKIGTQQIEHISSPLPSGEPSSWLTGISPADVFTRDPRRLPLIEKSQTAENDVLTKSGNLILCQLVPWQFAQTPMNQKRTFRRTSFLLTRLLCNLGVACTSPVLDDMAKPVNGDEKRWLHGLYLDTPEEWDDPYRFFGW